MLKENDFDKIERYINGQSDNDEKAWVESLFLNGEDIIHFVICLKMTGTIC